jgi:hypothetical protein
MFICLVCDFHVCFLFLFFSFFKKKKKIVAANFSRYRFKFDDERVTKEDVKRALEEQYGGEEEVL